MNELPLAVLMLVLGMAIHFVKKWQQIKKDTGVIVKPTKYWAENPYHTAMVILGGIAGVVILHSTGQLTPVTALGLGYIADSVCDTLGSRAITKLK